MNPACFADVHNRERNMQRTMFSLLVLAASMLLLAAGCNKADKQKKIDTNKIEETAPILSSVPEAEERTVSDQEAAQQRDAERADTLRSELIAMMPEYSFSHNEQQDTMEGEGLPQGGVPLDSLVTKLEDRVQKLQSNPGTAEYQQLIRVMLTQFQAAGMTPADSPDAREESATTPPASAGSDEEANEYGLKKAPKVFGEWRSLREEAPNHITNHSDDYYKQLLVYYERNCMYSTFSKGQRVKHDEFDYRYDSGAGELLLTATNGRYNMSFQCFVRDTEPGLLYVKQPNGTTYTVYEKIGRGEEPWTEEEKQRFLELQKEIGGSTGGAKENNE